MLPPVALYVGDMITVSPIARMASVLNCWIPPGGSVTVEGESRRATIFRLYTLAVDTSGTSSGPPPSCAMMSASPSAASAV